MSDEKFSPQESLKLIDSMINKAKSSFHESGWGPILWGSVITFCSMVTFFQIKYHFELPFDIWLLTLIAIVPQVYFISKERKRKKARSHHETIMDYVWTCFGISVFLLIFINYNIVSKLNPVFQTYIDVKGTRPVFNYSSFSSSFFLLLYGIPTIITAGCHNYKPMLYGGILCWICCVISVYTTIDWDMLLIALAAICAWLVPGIILWKRNKKSATVNV